MALFAGRNRNGTSADFKGDGSSSAFIMSVGAITARPIRVANHESQDVSTSVALQNATTAISSGATHALVSVDAAETDGVRFTEGGSNAASATEGHEISPGQAFELAVNPLSDVRLAAVSGTITVQISYRRYDTAA